MTKEQIMEKTTSWFQGIDLGPTLEVMEKFIWVDWIALTLLILGVLYGMKKGTMRMIAEIVEMVFVIYMTMEIYPKVVHYLTNTVDGLSIKIATPISFIITLSLSWVFVTIIDSYLRKLLHTQLLFIFRILGGAFLGVIGSVLVAGLFAQTLYLMPAHKIKKPFQAGASVTGSTLVQVIPTTHKFIKNPRSFLTAKSKSKSKESE